MFVPSLLRSEIARLHETGLSAPAIARELNVAPATVRYHISRVTRGRGQDDEVAPPEQVLPGRTQVPTRAAVARLLETGMTRAQIARHLDISKATVTYHARRLSRPVDERCARRYDWELIQSHYDAGHSVRECMAAFGFSSASWFDAVKRGAVIARPAEMPIEDLLKPGTYRGRYHLKARLIAEGLKQNRCEECGLIDWQGRPITMALHHVNGVRDDNRLENLQILCPNCHSQTGTFAGRNARARDPTARPIVEDDRRLS